LPGHKPMKDRLTLLFCANARFENKTATRLPFRNKSFELVPVHHIVNEIVSLFEMIGSKMDNNDIEELVEEHRQELTTEELTELHRVSQKETERSLSGMEEVIAELTPSGEIKKMLKSWETVALYIEKHHPDKTVTMRAINLFSDNVVLPFHQILKHSQKQLSLDNFLIKKA
jgi:hypothetical protein